MKKIKIFSALLAVVLTLTLMFTMSLTALADDAAAAPEVMEAAADDATGSKAIAAAIVVGIASAVGAIAMGLAIAKSVESMARQPEAAGKINSAMMLGLVFVETLIIYALIVAILIIFVL